MTKARLRVAPVQPPELDRDLERIGDVQGAQGETQGGFTRFLGIAIVLTTLAAAAVEFAHAYDGMKGDDASLRAQQLGVESTRQLMAAQQEGQAQFDTFVVAEEQRTSEANSNQRLTSPVANTNTAATKLERSRWNQLAARTEGLTEITNQGSTGPLQDPSFPDRYFDAKLGSADRAWALQDAANEEAGAWRDITTRHAAVLTMLAIAVYLFGLSLTVRLRINRYLAGLGVALVLIGASWAGWSQLNPVRPAPDQAAEEFAQARLAVATAYLQPGVEGYKHAYDHYSRAIALRPTFAQAYHERGLVAFVIGSPQRSQIVNFSSPEWLNKSTADDQKAYDLRLRTKEVVGDLAWDVFLQSLQSGDSKASRQAIDYTVQALAIDHTDPILHYNHGVQLLAVGRFSESRRAYQEAVTRTVYSDVSKHTYRSEIDAEKLLGGALTDLELVQYYRPSLTQQIRALKETLANEVLEPGLPLGPVKDVVKLNADTFPSFVQWTAELPGYDPKTDRASVQWYFRPAASSGSDSFPGLWSVLPEVSGKLPYGENGTSRWGQLERDSSGSADAFFNQNNNLINAGRCLENGDYRVELYIDGRLAAQNEVPRSTTTLGGQQIRDLDVGLCRPTSWVSSAKDIRGLSEGYVSADGSRGLYVFRFDHPSPQGDIASIVRGDLGRTVSAFGDRFPAPLRFDSTGDYDVAQLDAPAVAYYTYNGGVLEADAGFTYTPPSSASQQNDGATIVIAVFGPSDYMQSDEPGWIIESLFMRT